MAVKMAASTAHQWVAMTVERKASQMAEQ
jgi:hypothetical protein